MPSRQTTRYWALAIASACVLEASPAGAQSARIEQLPELVVSGAGQAEAGSLTQPGVARQREILQQTAGSVGFVESESFKDRFTNTLFDVLKYEPGVIVQPRYGQELRVSIRGSGLSRGFHLRGIELLQDGIPVNLADGTGDNYQIDPLGLRAVEIYKGANGLAFGSSTLGGAINLVTPTAQTAIAPNIMRAEGGSFGTLRLNAQISRVLGDVDALANATVTHSDGYRAHSRQQAEQFNGNLGYRISPDAETRFYWGAYVVDQQLPGTLSLDQALRAPRTASAAALAGDQVRDTRTERLANRTSVRLDTGQIDVDTWVIHKNLYHPIFQVLDQDGWTYGTATRYSGDFDFAGHRNQFIVGGRFIGGNTTALQFLNVGGTRGAQTLDSRQDAYNTQIFAENRFFLASMLALTTGFKALHDERRYVDRGGLAANPLAKSDAQTYEAFNPKLGLLFEPRPDLQFFADIARSADVPDFTDLNQTIGTTTRFVPLRAQNAWTAELGGRGKIDRVSFDVTFYRSVVRDELLQFTVDPSILASTFNAPRTLHQGNELGAAIELARGLAAEGDALTLRQLWNHNDFRFQGDAQYGNNRIAGAPPDVLRSVLSYTHPSGFYLAPNLDWVPAGAFADQANTLRAPGYFLVGLQTGVQMTNGVLMYLEARNLADRRTITDISTVTDARRVATQIFYPGDGRSVFAGVRATF